MGIRRRPTGECHYCGENVEFSCTVCRRCTSLRAKVTYWLSRDIDKAMDALKTFHDAMRRTTVNDTQSSSF